VLALSTPIIACGDIYGQLYDLFELVDTGGLPSSMHDLFQGDDGHRS
jgi:hypothetical protein